LQSGDKHAILFGLQCCLLGFTACIAGTVVQWCT